MSAWIIALILVFNIILQSTVFQYIAVLGIRPDSAIAIVVALSTFLGKEYGMIIGVAAGMMQDIVFSRPVGITALSYMLIGYLVGSNSDKIFKENLVVPLAFSAGATLLKYFIGIFFDYVLGIPISLLIYIQQYLLIELVYNCAISIVIYKALYWVYGRKLLKDGLRIKRKR
jgi:rod shape-determining protein MreD